MSALAKHYLNCPVGTDFVSEPTIRVLHCVYSLAWGGAEKQLYLLTNASQSAGMESAVFCVDTAGMSPARMNCEIHTYQRQRKLDVGIYHELRRVMRAFRPDVVHVWLPAVITIPAMLAAALDGVPCVFSYRCAMQFWALPQIPEYLVMLPLANKIVTNNPIEQSGALFRWAYRAKSGEQIDNAVNPVEIYPEPVPLVDKSQRVLLFVGRIEAQKNWPCLLQAFALLRKTRDYELQVCGQGDQQAQMIAMVDELGLGEAVRMLGHRKDVPALMRAADVVVLPSLYEGTPNVALEACAAGVPLVVSDIEAHALFREAGAARLFETKSPEALANAIEDVFHNPAATRLAQLKGQKLVAQRSPQAMASRYREAYQDSIQRGRRKMSKA